MRSISSQLQAHLDAKATTLCTCWRVVRMDGVPFGFTDHDRDLEFDGTLFRAQTGITGSVLESTADLAVDNSTIEGALAHDSITEEDIRAGRYDEAKVTIWRVNWDAPEERLLLKRGTIGQIERGDLGFTAEMRSQAHKLDEVQGRIYQYTCDAVLGDTRCGIDLDDPSWRAMGQVGAATQGASVLVSGLSSAEEDFFAGGVLRVENGQSAGLVRQIRSHAQSGANLAVQLWQALNSPVATGDGVTLTAGCDKRFETCRTKFANGRNFRGAPHMPGNDAVIAYPVRGDDHDGGKR